ncbi:uncharacterized protein [Bactrocera oleae]|uniref:uncharacterized protein n=1 Tax=Bactrocera oleae TaxID=104688 RepID=UPI00387E7ABA
MNKKLIRCLCYLIFTLLTVSVGRVKALKDKDSEQPFTIFLDAGNEIRNVVNSLASYGRKQDGMEEILKSAQNVMEKMEERLMELESTVKAAANVEKIVEPCRKLLEIRLGDIENKLNAMESIQRKNHALIEQRLDELGLNLRSTLRQQGEPNNQFRNGHYGYYVVGL